MLFLIGLKCGMCKYSKANKIAKMSNLEPFGVVPDSHRQLPEQRGWRIVARTKP